MRTSHERWERMTLGAAQIKKALSLSKFAKFDPPQQRSKARYMNLDSLVKWGYAMDFTRIQNRLV